MSALFFHKQKARAGKGEVGMARLCPLYSGSKGNCYYIGSGSGGVLIDAGRSAKQIETAMRDNGLDMAGVRGIFVTHEHTDHIQGLRVLASRYHLNVYASKGTLEALDRQAVLNDKYKTVVIPSGGVQTDDMHIIPFHTSHDCRESMGFVVRTGDGRSIAVATDTGILSEEIETAVSGCDAVVIESNHDVGMLLNGIYPYPLKRRILSDRGHLSNDACAEFLPRLVDSGTTRLILAHLSRENNMPHIAEQSALCSLDSFGMRRGSDFMLSVAPEVTRGELIVL